MCGCWILKLESHGPSSSSLHHPILSIQPRKGRPQRPEREKDMGTKEEGALAESEVTVH